MKLNLERPLAFFDLETTGTNVATDRIVEISIIKVNPDQSKDKYTKRINPTVPIPPSSSAIHGIYDKDVATAPSFEYLAQETGTTNCTGMSSTESPEKCSADPTRARTATAARPNPEACIPTGPSGSQQDIRPTPIRS